MTFAAVGSLIQQQNASTFSLTPGGVGDLILIEIIQRTNNSVFASSLSSSNVTWTQFGSTFAGTTNTWAAVIFIGQVTSVSNATVTVTWSGATPSNIRIAGQEFSTTAGFANVALDTQGNLDGAGTATWPSLTPGHGSGELYFGYAIDSVAATAGSTSGYTYDIDSFSNGLAFNPACGGSATSPVWGDSTQVFGIMVLAYETFVATSGPPVSLVVVNRPALIVSNSGWRGAGHSR